MITELVIWFFDINTKYPIIMIPESLFVFLWFIASIDDNYG